MRFQSFLASVALLATIVLAGPIKAKGASYDDRAVLVGRQKIRSELATAMADGHLTRMDQYRILLHAREVLPPEDLPGLEKTLDRLATAEERVGPPRKQGFGDTRLTGAEVVVPGKPVALPEAKVEYPGVMPGKESPFVEERPELISELPMDDDMGACGRRRGLYSGCGLPDCTCMDGCSERPRLCIEAASTVEAFKGPMDLDDLNGNFGTGLGLNGGIPLLPRWGLGLQAGSKVIMSDFHGSLFTDAGTRDQDFTSVGLFQRIPVGEGSIDWGFTYDWLIEHYYTNFMFTQWRVKAAWEMNPWNEFGGWATIHDRGGSATVDFTSIGSGILSLHFKPLTEGNFYWRHTWCNDVSLTTRLGMAQAPNSVIVGMDGLVPISPRLALTSTFSYISPSARGGQPGQSQEIWNVAVGLEFALGGFRRCPANRFAPLLPVADNGTMAIREVP